MTTLAPQYDPSAIEADIYKRWLDAGVFGTTPEPDRIPYVIVIPPPNVTAVLHSGHGLNNTLQDVLIRFQRMRGRDALEEQSSLLQEHPTESQDLQDIPRPPLPILHRSSDETSTPRFPFS